MTPITFTILNFKKQNKERLSPPFHVSPQIVFISRSVQCKWDSIFLDNNDLSLVVVVGQWCPSSTRRRWTTSTSSGVTRPSLSAWFRPSWPTLSRWRPGSRTTARPTCRNTRAMVIFFLHYRRIFWRLRLDWCIFPLFSEILSFSCLSWGSQCYFNKVFYPPSPTKALDAKGRSIFVIIKRFFCHLLHPHPPP